MRKIKKATRPMIEKMIESHAKKGYRNRGKDWNKVVPMKLDTNTGFTPAEIQLLVSQNRWINLPYLHIGEQVILKKEIVMDIYPLTAEEYLQSEKVTATEVLEVLNNSDVEVE